jgi:cytochrome c
METCVSSWRGYAAAMTGLAVAVALSACVTPSARLPDSRPQAETPTTVPSASQTPQRRTDAVPAGLTGPELAAAGRSFVATHCSTCHAVDRAGTSPNPDAPEFRTLAARYPLENLAEALGEGIFVGHPMMPQFELAPEEVDAVIAWLRAIQNPAPQSGP